jgi:hypothetical protein
MARHGRDPVNNERAQAWVLLLVLLAVIAVYLPHVGRGFVSDDFIWLRESLHDGRIDLARTFTSTTGFFRPVVSLSFAVQRLLHGSDPRPYGLLNLLLHLANVLLAFRLLRRWERTRPLAAWVALLFALSFKPAGMALGWISGRSDLLFSMFMLLALAACPLAGRPATGLASLARHLPCAVFYLAALLAKETAAAAPLFVFLFSFLGLQGPPRPGGLLKKSARGLLAALPFLAAWTIYFLLRFRSDAFTPASAPAYYRLGFSPLRFMRNLGEYATRSAWLEVLLLLVLLGALLIARRRMLRRPGAGDRAVILAGLLWFLCLLLPCLFLEARSDLYAYLPQLGLHAAFLSWLAGYFRPAAESRPAPERPLAVRWPLLALLAGWSIFLGYQARARAQQALAGSLFFRRAAAVAQRLEPGKRLLVVDTQAGERTAPSRVVGYGLEAMLHLLAPGKDLRGEFVTVDAARCLAGRDLKKTVAYVWQDGELRPLKRSRRRRSGKPVQLLI